MSDAGVQPIARMRGLGPASVQMLAQAGIHTSADLKKTDLFALYARIKAQQPKASINLLYAMIGAVEDQDWRSVAKERRSEVLMRLDDMGLL